MADIMCGLLLSVLLHFAVSTAQQRVNTTAVIINNSTNSSPVNNITSTDFVNIENITDNCPQLCNCHYSNSRTGFIVDCSNRNLTKIPAFIPNGVIYVNLRHNAISALANDSFEHWYTKSIQKLSLSYNNISVIEANAFQYFNHLWAIDLSHNHLSEIDHVKLPIIHELNLKGNWLTTDYESRFERNGFKKYQMNEIGDCDIIYKRTTVSKNETFVKFFGNVDTILTKSKCVETLTSDINATLTFITTPCEVSVQNIQHMDEDFPKPTFAEVIFYCSLLVVFFGLMLFLVSQNYDHAWTKYLPLDENRKKSPSTRRPTVNIHSNPHHNVQSPVAAKTP